MWRFKQKVIQAVFEIGNSFWVHVNFGRIHIEQFHVNKLIKAETESFLEKFIYIYIYIFIIYIYYVYYIKQRQYYTGILLQSKNCFLISITTHLIH